MFGGNKFGGGMIFKTEVVNGVCPTCSSDLVEYIEAKGQTAARTRILRVIEHGYEDGEYDAGRY